MKSLFVTVSWIYDILYVHSELSYDNNPFIKLKYVVVKRFLNEMNESINKPCIILRQTEKQIWFISYGGASVIQPGILSMSLGT